MERDQEVEVDQERVDKTAIVNQKSKNYENKYTI